MTSGPLLLYDGHCALCHRSVAFALARDPRGVIRYATLDGPHGARVRAAHPELAAVSSVVLVDAAGVHVRSEAALRLASYLTAPWPAVARAARVVPRAIRDTIYRLVARVRYRVFGRFETCPVPPPAARDRFLD